MDAIVTVHTGKGDRHIRKLGKRPQEGKKQLARSSKEKRAASG